MHYLVYNLSHIRGPLLSADALDATEQEAYARRGEPYLKERTLLRRELARLTGTAAEAIRFCYTEHGKPECAAQPFNLSHSGELLCLAFHHAAVGVDIERMRPTPRRAAIAKRIMCPEQLEAWQKRGCPEQEFFDCWCAAEAIIKWRGATIWHAASFPFLYHEGRISPCFEAAPVVQLFTPAPGYAGAIAYGEESSEA